jgi:DNA-binding response OmpR family regulator
LKGRRILVVEDEYFLADDIGRALQALDASVVGPVGDLTDGMAMLNDDNIIDGAVLDINVRDEKIFPLARELKARNVPFVFTTGYDSNVLEAEFQRVPRWTKPVDVSAVAFGLAQLIARDEQRS